MSPRVRQPLRTLALCALAACAAVGLAGCRGERSDAPPRQFLPDMDDQPKWKPQSESTFFADGRTMRPPVEGAVPFGVSTVVSDEPWATPFNVKRSEFLAAESEVYFGVDEAGDFVTEIPVPVDMTMLLLGKKKFDIYCAVCHGYNGEGSRPNLDPDLGSMVGRVWSIPVASFHDPRFQPGGEFGQAGYLYQIARNGKGVLPAQSMPGYAHAIDPIETWAVIAYIRALQRSHQGTLEDVPEDIRAALGPRPAPPPEPEPEAAPETPATGGES